MSNNVNTGALCGGCTDNKGFSVLLNRCVTCADASGLLILVLSKSILSLYLQGSYYFLHPVVADISFFMGIMLIDKPLASWIYPFLFYMQVDLYIPTYPV